MYYTESSQEVNSAWRSVKLVYVLHLIGAFTALPFFLGAILSHVKLDDGDEVTRSHFTHQVGLFWAFLVMMVIATPLILVFGLGYLMMLGVWVWFVWNLVTGLMRALDELPAKE